MLNEPQQTMLILGLVLKVVFDVKLTGTPPF
jgi:hypothetical protein